MLSLSFLHTHALSFSPHRPSIIMNSHSHTQYTHYHPHLQMLGELEAIRSHLAVVVVDRDQLQSCLGNCASSSLLLAPSSLYTSSLISFSGVFYPLSFLFFFPPRLPFFGSFSSMDLSLRARFLPTLTYFSLIRYPSPFALSLSLMLANHFISIGRSVEG